MGCSSSALGKAGDSGRLRSAASNERLSAAEQPESCAAQPEAHVPGAESALLAVLPSASAAPPGKPRAAVRPTANGVGSRPSPPPAKDAVGRSGPPEETQALEGPRGGEPGQPGGGDGTPGTEERREEAGRALEVRALKENAETAPSGTEAVGQPSRAAGPRGPPGAGEGTGPGTFLGTAENSPPPETAGELPSQEATGEDTQSQLPETPTEQNRSPETLQGNQSVETAQEQQPQEALRRDECAQSRLLETTPEAGGTPEIEDRSPPEQPPATNVPVHATAHDSRIPEQIRPEGLARGREHPAGIAETAAYVEVDGERHATEEEQRTEGEEGEKVDTETENEKVSEEAETKEEETGEAVDLSAAT